MTKQPESPAVVVELETGVERLAGWIGANPWLAGGILVGAIVLAGAIGGYSSWRASQDSDASNALDLVRGEYLREMGAPPGAIEVPELANPKAGQAPLARGPIATVAARTPIRQSPLTGVRWIRRQATSPATTSRLTSR